MGSRTACWLLLAIVNADVLELKVDDDLAVQARAEFAKFDQKIAPADAAVPPDAAGKPAYTLRGGRLEHLKVCVMTRAVSAAPRRAPLLPGQDCSRGRPLALSAT